MKPKRIIKINPGLAPFTRNPRNTSGNNPTSQGPSPATPAPSTTTQPTSQTPLVPNRTFMHTPGGWKILSEPVTYPQYPGVLFLEFQDPNHATLMQPAGGADLAKLRLEVNTLLRGQNKKIVLELPPLWLSTEVSNTLSAMKRSLKSPDILVLLSRTPHPQAGFLAGWGFHISSDLHNAAQIAQVGHYIPLLPAPPQIPLPPSGSWQILNKPAFDPKYPGICFLEFQDPNSVKLTNTQDLCTLYDELDTITNYPKLKIVFELPPTRFSKEVTTLLLGFCISQEENGKCIFLFPSWSTKAQAMQELGLSIARTEADAYALTQGQSTPQNTNSILTGSKIYPSSHSIFLPPNCGYWQIFEEPSQDPKYPGVNFINFQLPDYVSIESQKDTQILNDEVNYILDEKTIINLPDKPPVSKNVMYSLLGTNLWGTLVGANIVYLFPLWTSQALALQELNFDIFCDRDLAANAVLSLNNPPLLQTNNLNASSGGAPSSSGTVIPYP